LLEFEEQRLKLKGYLEELNDLKDAIAYEATSKKIADLEEQTAKDDFWSQVDNSQKILQQISQLKSIISSYDKLYQLYDDTLALIDIADEEEDISFLEEIEQSINSFCDELSTQRLQTLLSGEYDKNNAILTFHAGAGGTEAQDWAEMLVRMYSHWGESHKFKVKMIDFLDGEEAGLKSAVLLIEGINAYGYLKSESGVHRLVRVSPFDSSGRRHTSFASLEVMPEITDDVEVEIREDELKVDTYRSSGAGGQHVNKTESAIRITHIPTGIVVACQSERSQTMNRATAMGILKARLYEYYREEKEKENAKFAQEKKDIAWGNQIRSYVFQPYTMVKDHRTKYEIGNIQSVMDGNLDPFIEAFLAAKWKGLPLGSDTDD